MADIASLQNQEENLNLLAAQSYFYACAKRFAALQVVAAAATPIISAVMVALDPAAAVWAAFIGIVVSLIEFGALDLLQEHYRDLAAAIQEQFDCNVLQLNWNEAVAGMRPSPEDIHEGATAYGRPPTISNWYPPAVSKLAEYEGRIVCQRTNCWWDSKLRRRYAIWIMLIIGLISLSSLAVAIATGITVEKFVLAVMAPLSPMLLWGIREVRRQREAAARLDQLKEYGQSLWRSVITKAIDEPTANQRSRELQDAIFIRRKSNPFVFDWIYRLLRRKYEDQMNVGAQAMINEATAH